MLMSTRLSVLKYSEPPEQTFLNLSVTKFDKPRSSLHKIRGLMDRVMLYNWDFFGQAVDCFERRYDYKPDFKLLS